MCKNAANYYYNARHHNADDGKFQITILSLINKKRRIWMFMWWWLKKENRKIERWKLHIIEEPIEQETCINDHETRNNDAFCHLAIGHCSTLAHIQTDFHTTKREKNQEIWKKSHSKVVSLSQTIVIVLPEWQRNEVFTFSFHIRFRLCSAYPKTFQIERIIWHEKAIIYWSCLNRKCSSDGETCEEGNWRAKLK